MYEPCYLADYPRVFVKAKRGEALSAYENVVLRDGSAAVARFATQLSRMMEGCHARP